MTIKEFRSLCINKLTVFSKREASYILDIFISDFFDNKTNYFSIQEMIIEDKLKEYLDKVVQKLNTNEPFQYILGNEEFYGYNFKVNKNVLIPRPETEELVEWVIDTVKNLDKNLNILDIGTGSGCIPISIAKNIDNAVIHACDISNEAIKLAKENNIKLQTNVNFFEQDILDEKLWKYKNKYDIIISNPPYIPNSEKTLMHSNVLDFEPNIALFVENENPLLFYNTISKFALKNLAINGFLFFECNEYNAKKVVELLKKLKFKNIELKKDLSGKDRMIKAEL